MLIKMFNRKTLAIILFINALCMSNIITAYDIKLNKTPQESLQFLNKQGKVVQQVSVQDVYDKAIKDSIPYYQKLVEYFYNYNDSIAVVVKRERHEEVVPESALEYAWSARIKTPFLSQFLTIYDDAGEVERQLNFPMSSIDDWEVARVIVAPQNSSIFAVIFDREDPSGTGRNMKLEIFNRFGRILYTIESYENHPLDEIADPISFSPNGHYLFANINTVRGRKYLFVDTKNVAQWIMKPNYGLSRISDSGIVKIYRTTPDGIESKQIDLKEKF